MTIEERANQAAEWKAAGIYNCAQAVTQAFADQIGADYYTADAATAAETAKAAVIAKKG